MEDAMETKNQKKTSSLAFSITSILNSESSHGDREECSKEHGGKKVEDHSRSSNIDEEEESVSEHENKDEEEEEEEEDYDRDEEYSESNYDGSEHDTETENESDHVLEENNSSKESLLDKTTNNNNNAIESMPSLMLNEEFLLNYCRSYGIESSNLNQIESNKYLLKMLLTSQTTSSMYSSLFSTLLANLNNSNASNSEFLIAKNVSEQSKSSLEMADDNNLNSSPLFQKRIGHPYQNRNPPKRKKPRTSFNRPQIVELEKRFVKQKYLASNERSTLAKSLKMTDAQVKTWFQNRRTKWRRQNVEEKEAQRQAANKLMMSLKLQHQQNPMGLVMKNNLGMDQQNIQNQIAFQNSLSSLTTALSASGNVMPLSLPIENINRNGNPLNKLMDMAFKVDNSKSSSLNSE